MPRKSSLKVVESPEIEIRWRTGFIPPKGIAVTDVKVVLDELPDRSPEMLYEASKDASHLLHDEVWGRGDQEWARVARIEHCRRIISNVVEIVRTGGREIETRAYEYVRETKQWATIEEIVADPVMRTAHFESIQRMLDEASGKFARFRELTGLA